MGKLEIRQKNEVGMDKTLKELIDDIEEDVYIRMTEEGVADLDWDAFEEGYFFNEVRYRIRNHAPGWEILQKEYGDI